LHIAVMTLVEEDPEARRRLGERVGRSDADDVESLGARLAEKEGFRLLGVQKSRSA
jgi:hypothetical protein